jgi:hypothetical protein
VAISFRCRLTLQAGRRSDFAVIPGAAPRHEPAATVYERSWRSVRPDVCSRARVASLAPLAISLVSWRRPRAARWCCQAAPRPVGSLTRTRCQGVLQGHDRGPQFDTSCLRRARELCGAPGHRTLLPGPVDGGKGGWSGSGIGRDRQRQHGLRLRRYDLVSTRKRWLKPAPR